MLLVVPVGAVLTFAATEPDVPGPARDQHQSATGEDLPRSSTTSTVGARGRPTRRRTRDEANLQRPRERQRRRVRVGRGQERRQRPHGNHGCVSDLQGDSNWTSSSRSRPITSQSSRCNREAIPRRSPGPCTARPFISKLMQVFINLDNMIGKDFEAGLANLKARAEG